MNRKAMAAAFPTTVPVLMGYLAIGMAFGLMLNAAGYNVIWAFFMSLTIYAGSGQYLGVTLLATGAALLEVAMLTLILNFRHLVYGLSMLEKFRGIKGFRKFYLIFSLTDETYALLSSAQVPIGVRPTDFYLSVAVLNHFYWIAGTVIGGVAGALLQFNTEGIDFAMTALFVVIAVDQWKTYKSHLPALLGLGATVVSLLLLGPDRMLPPALAVIVLALLAMRVRLGRAEEQRDETPVQPPKERGAAS